MAVHRIIAIALAHTDRLIYSRAEAAEAFGVSVEFFERYVAPEIRVIRRGRRLLYPLGELLFWIWRASDEPEPVGDAIERSSS